MHVCCVAGRLLINFKVTRGAYGCWTRYLEQRWAQNKRLFIPVTVQCNCVYVCVLQCACHRKRTCSTANHAGCGQHSKSISGGKQGLTINFKKILWYAIELVFPPVLASSPTLSSCVAANASAPAPATAPTTLKTAKPADNTKDCQTAPTTLKTARLPNLPAPLATDEPLCSVETWSTSSSSWATGRYVINLHWGA